MSYFCQFILYFFFFSLFLIPWVLPFSFTLFEERSRHTRQPLTDEELKTAVKMLGDFKKFQYFFHHISRPRVIGSKDHENVKYFILSELALMGWNIVTDHFSIGKLRFTNIISTHKSVSSRYLDLACHYDSKHFKNAVYVGATDAAVPCAMLLYIAHTFNHYLQNNFTNPVSLRLIFFDGTEPLNTWTESDFLYGSKHLADKWNYKRFRGKGAFTNQLDRIDLLVLLNLLGVKNPRFYSYFPKTYEWYQGLVQAEHKLFRKRYLQNHTNRYFYNVSKNIQIGDDHIPFFKKGVSVIHILPVEFPIQWHTPADNKNIIDLPTIYNLIKIVSVFMAEYMGMFKEI